MKIGYVGLGALGSSLAKRLLATHALTVWDINPAAVSAFARLGAATAATAADLARNCDVVVLCLPRSSDVHQLLFGVDGMEGGLSPGKLVIDQTSGIPAQTRVMAARLRRAGIDMMDASVSGTPVLALNGGATLMAAAPDTVFARALPVLRAITATVHRCGTRVGDGQAMKMVNNAMNGGNRVGSLELAALGRGLGLSLETMTAVLHAGTGANQIVERMFPALVAGRQSTDFSLALMLKDLSQAVSLGIEFGVPMPISATVRGLLQAGLNVLGPSARLEDVVGVVESWNGTRLADAAGTDLADAAVDAGHPSPPPVLGYAGSDDLVARRLGLAPSNDPPSLASTCDAIVLGPGVADRDVLFDALPAGRGIVVVLLGGDLAHVRERAAELAGREVVLLDAAPVPLRDGGHGAFLLACGGDAAAWARLRPTLAAAGVRTIHCGASGNGHIAALVNANMEALGTALTLECMTAGLKYGLELDDMCRILPVTSGWSTALRRILPGLAAGRQFEAAGLATTVADLQSAAEAGIAVGAPTMVLNIVRGAFEAALNGAGPEAPLEALVQEYERSAGVALFRSVVTE